MAIITKVAGQQIQNARKEKGLTQKELGEKLGISESAVNRYEGGKQNFTLLTLQKIVDTLGIEINLSIRPE